MSEKKFIAALSVNAPEDFQLLAANIAEVRNTCGFSQREMTSLSLMSPATYPASEKAKPSALCEGNSELADSQFCSLMPHLIRHWGF